VIVSHTCCWRKPRDRKSKLQVEEFHRLLFVILIFRYLSSFVCLFVCFILSLFVFVILTLFPLCTQYDTLHNFTVKFGSCLLIIAINTSYVAHINVLNKKIIIIATCSDHNHDVSIKHMWVNAAIRITSRFVVNGRNDFLNKTF